MIRLAAGGAVLLLAACTTPRLAEFERTLAAQDSATAALGQWCQARRLADPPTIRAEQAGTMPQPLPEIRRLLAAPDEPLAYRHVRIVCGDAVLSEADNWYVPGRLTAGMNETLASTRTPFGRVVAPLGFRRERLSSARGRAADCPKGTVLSHRARLVLPDGRPLSLVTECYTRANLN
jgi:chorismate-pyruvate lyase